MPCLGFELITLAFKQQNTVDALDLAATVTVQHNSVLLISK
jgi:hypothetical protein